MIKFKKYDVVRIKSLDKIKTTPFYENFAREMERYCGTIQRVYAIFENAWYKSSIQKRTNCYKLEDTGHYSWSEEWLEPVLNSWEGL